MSWNISHADKGTTRLNRMHNQQYTPPVPLWFPLYIFSSANHQTHIQLSILLKVTIPILYPLYKTQPVPTRNSLHFIPRFKRQHIVKNTTTWCQISVHCITSRRKGLGCFLHTAPEDENFLPLLLNLSPDRQNFPTHPPSTPSERCLSPLLAEQSSSRDI